MKVATFADGLDPNNPDLIRANGQHVIADYQDFSGDGPNAPTGAAEAFGDVSSVAAQGNQTYDISQFVNPAHPLPAGCNIKIRGIAPGATLDVMKVFGNSNSAFNSTILEGLDYALSNDHPDVFSESFGGYPIPDSTQDITRQFNEQAFNAGAVVVESSGDSGVEASPSSAGSDPDVIDAGASTTFRNYAQATQYGFQFAKGFLSDNISSIESAGFTQGGRVVDLVAPGESNWALCSANTAIFEECTNYAGQPTNLQVFGGTSESAPFIAGGAALVIQAYRAAHGGNNPSPLLVRQLMTSTATDLGQPSVEEGAGEIEHARSRPGRPGPRQRAVRRQREPPPGDPEPAVDLRSGRVVREQVGEGHQPRPAQPDRARPGARDHDPGLQPDRFGQPEQRQPHVRRPVRRQRGVTGWSRSTCPRRRQAGLVHLVDGRDLASPVDADRPERQLRDDQQAAGERQPRRSPTSPIRSAASGPRSSSCATEP